MGTALTLNHFSLNIGWMWDFQFSTNYIYSTSYNGERFKIDFSTTSIVWAVDYGDMGLTITLSLDGTHLLAGA